MRYLVIIPPHAPGTQARHRPLESGRPLVEGDDIVLDETLMRVVTIVDSPTPDGHDATVICTRPVAWRNRQVEPPGVRPPDGSSLDSR